MRKFSPVAELTDAGRAYLERQAVVVRIVVDLADSDPLAEILGGDPYCALCGADDGDLENPNQHSASCPWARAKRWSQ